MNRNQLLGTNDVLSDDTILLLETLTCVNDLFSLSVLQNFFFTDFFFCEFDRISCDSLSSKHLIWLEPWFFNVRLLHASVVFSISGWS